MNINQIQNIRIKAIQEIKDETIFYTKATITKIEKKISRKRITFYNIAITDGLKKTTVCLSPEHFEQDIQDYEKKILDDYEPCYRINDEIDLSNFINIPCSMKLKCIQSKDTSTMNYFLLEINKVKSMSFKYTNNSKANKAANIMCNKEDIENIQSTEIYTGSIDYRIALENISIFEELVFQDKAAEIIIYNLDNEILDVYKKIFDFIARGGNLIYHVGGIIKKQTPEKIQSLKYEKELLKDIRYRFFGCFGGFGNFNEEREICSIIFNERDRLKKIN